MKTVNDSLDLARAAHSRARELAGDPLKMQSNDLEYSIAECRISLETLGAELLRACSDGVFETQLRSLGEPVLITLGPEVFPTPPPAVELRAPLPDLDTRVAELSEHLREGGFSESPPPAEPDYPTPDAVVNLALRALGLTGGPLADLARADAESTSLGKVLLMPESWASLEPAANRALTAWATARARRLQVFLQAEDSPAAQFALSDIERIIRRLSRHSQSSRPGFVYGLAQTHEPPGGSWHTWAVECEHAVLALLPSQNVAEKFNPDDVVRVLTERARVGLLEGPELTKQAKALIRAGLPAKDKRLISLARPHAQWLDGVILKPLRDAVRELEDAQAAVDESPRSQSISGTVLGCTRGRRAVIMGGDPRPEHTARLKFALELEDLEWVEGTTTRRVGALTERMASGSVELVILLRAWNSHQNTDRIWGARSPRCDVVLADTYSVSQVARAIERYLVVREAA